MPVPPHRLRSFQKTWPSGFCGLDAHLPRRIWPHGTTSSTYFNDFFTTRICHNFASNTHFFIFVWLTCDTLHHFHHFRNMWGCNNVPSCLHGIGRCQSKRVKKARHKKSQARPQRSFLASHPGFNPRNLCKKKYPPGCWRFVKSGVCWGLV